MITCGFNGRLGNNLFQIANAISVSKKLNTDLVLPEQSYCGHRGVRNVELNMFEYKFNRGVLSAPVIEYNEPTFHYTEIPLQDNMRLSGFYQSWKYFEDIRVELINTYFKFSTDIESSATQHILTGLNTLGISVRRGDYLMLQHNHCVLGIDYYQEVIDKYFSEGIDMIYVFSDDIDWCKSVFGDSVIYVQDTPGVQLCLMTKMQNLIISNSTFAWWGAYLNTKAKYIIAPEPWFGTALCNHDTKDLLYPSWIVHRHNIQQQPYEISEKFFD